MRYQISGQQIDIGEALQNHVRNELNVIIQKYAERPVGATISFSKDAHEFVCEATVHLSTGLTAQAKARAVEIYAAFDNCGEKMEKQLRRYKRRLKDHHKEPDSLAPVIIAETATGIQNLSVGEAVMQMELAGAPVLVFQNEGSKGINVVYRRDDGNIGWIEPQTVT